MKPPFIQPAPALDNLYSSDRLLTGFLQRTLPPDLLAAIEPELVELGALAAGPVADLQRADRLHEPVLTQWDAWGNRVDHIELTPLWREAERLTVRFGLTAIPYERRAGEWSRVRVGQALGPVTARGPVSRNVVSSQERPKS